MIDPYSLHQSNSQNYTRAAEFAEIVNVPYLQKRGEAMAKAKAAASKVSVKKPGTATPATPAAAPKPSGFTGSTNAPKDAPDLSGYDEQPNRPFTTGARLSTFGAKGYNQPEVTRSAVSRNIPAQRTNPYAGKITIQQQPKAPVTPTPSASPTAAPVEGWAARTGHALINRANQIGAERTAQQQQSPAASPAPRASTESWAARTGKSLIMRAEQIGTERAVQRRTFGSAATSHTTTGQGRRAF